MTTTEQPAPSGFTMLYVHGTGYVNARSAASLGMKGEEAYDLPEPPATAIGPKKRPARKADNDNVVFDMAEAARELPDLEPELTDWTPPSTRAPRGALHFRYGNDGPAISWRLDAQAARVTSNKYSGQVANDNVDWPLAKLLRAEQRYLALMTAERYRDLWNAANMPHDLVGRDANDLYVVENKDKDDKGKGIKVVKGKKARVDVAPKRAVAADPDKTEKRAKPIPKKWQGDWPLLNHIDAGRELAAAQGALGFLREAFEAAVVFGATLEEIGHDAGVGNKTGAKGAGRALVTTGLQCIDEFWAKRGQGHIEPESRPIWEPGNPVPIGYYRSSMYPDAIFKRAA